MKTRFNILMILWSFYCCLACRNEPKLPTVLATTVIADSLQTGFYKHFEGQLAGKPAVLDLIKSIQLDDEGHITIIYEGYYRCFQRVEPIFVQGGMKDGFLVLEEESPKGDTIPVTRLSGVLDTNDVFKGVWTDVAKNKKEAFEWTEKYPTGICALDYHVKLDSLVAKTINKELQGNPAAIFEMSVLMPRDSSVGAFFLKQKVFEHLKNSAQEHAKIRQLIAPQLPTPDSFLRARKNEYFVEYANEIRKLNSGKDSSEIVSLNYTQSHTMHILMNESDKLSIGYVWNGYSGGAHGNYGTGLKTYDLKKEQVLRLSDVFKPNSEKALGKALENAFRKQRALKPDESLEGTLFDNEIVPNDNFCLTPQGILFNYTPYEIASYAQGEIRIFLPNEVIKDILK
ncbi:MAG: hypothetical protein RIS64_3623 [Bacteroidota bacterium]